MLTRFTRWLKKYFIPHEHNDHKPHFLRSESVVVILGLVLFIEVAFVLDVLVLFPNTNFLASVLPGVLVDETNLDRNAGNVGSLALNPVLQRAAQLKADDMAAKSYFSHESPDGKTPWYWLEQVGYDYAYAGENLAVNFVDSEDLMVAWMNSPAHRANILNENFSEIGIAASRGNYEGRETTFVVQFFGKPVLAALSPTRVAAEPAQTEPKIGTTTLVAEEVPQVKGEVVQLEPAVTASQPSAAAKLLSKPRTVTDYFYFALLTLVGLALILDVFIKIKIQHPKLIVGGVLIFSIVGFALFANEIIALFQAQIL